MRRTLVYFALSIVTSLVGAQNSEPGFIKVGDGGTTSVAMSPNGKYAVGQGVGIGDAPMYKSYLWDAENGQLTWMTELDENDFDKSGHFADVNDEKTIVGNFKDENYILSYIDMDEQFSGPICVAAVWKDGKRTSLGIGDFTMDDFNSFADGSFAMAVSADSKTVVGYINQGNSTTFTPCGWVYNESTQAWDYQRYALPEGSQGGQIGSVSADGKLAVGYAAYHLRAMPVIWTSPTECLQIELTEEDASYEDEFGFNYGYKISPNGQYVLFTLNNMIPCIYSMKDRKYVKLDGYPDATGLSVNTISDQGDVVGAFGYGNYFSGTYTRPFWFSYKDNKCTDFEYLIQTYAQGVNIPFSFNFSDKITSNPQSISADGTIIFGTNGEESWILRTSSDRITLPDYVPNVRAVNSKLKEVTVSWDKAINIPTGFILKSYKVYCDDEYLGNVDASQAADASRIQYVQQGVSTGLHTYSVVGEYVATNGKVYESHKSIGVEIGVVNSFALPLFDNFDSPDFTENGWTNELLLGNPRHDLKWQNRTSGDPANETASLTAIVMTDEPYSATLTSRFMDATELDRVYVSFSKKLMYANRDDWDLTLDSLSLEFSTDDVNWVAVRDYPADKVVAGSWNYEQIDITKLAAHKQFKLRWRTHGKAVAELLWYIDTFKVGSITEKPAPEGLTGTISNGKVNLQWQNTFNAYELSYLENSTALYEVSFGDSEGIPLIIANAFDPDQLKMYDGKYITSVTTFLYEYLSDEVKQTRASILIYEDDKVISEQEISDQIINGYTFTVKLNHAVKIDANKKLKIAMKIFDYNPQSTPVYYQCSDLFVPGKSDLYSEDDGKTWKKLSDFYATVPGQEEWGYCNWPLRANVSDEEVITDSPSLDETLAGYCVYRNGVQINEGLIYGPYLKFTDEDPVDNGCYEVIAYYQNGDVSEVSAQYCVGVISGIQENDAVTIIKVYPNPADDYIYVEGVFDKLQLLTSEGRIILETTEGTIQVSGQPSGLYFLRVVSGSKVETHKVMIR